MQGFFLALHASTPAALGLAVLLHLWAPAWLAPLAQRPAWPMWALIGAWLLMSALASLALRPLALWRVALGGTAALLALAGGVGLARGAALAPAMLASMATLGLACLGLAAFIGPRRVHAGRRKTPQHGPAPAMGQTIGHAMDHTTQHTTQRSAGRRRGPLRCASVLAHWPFWLTGALAVESFRLAYIVAIEPARSSGMLGLLLAFFMALPGATLRAWAPGSSSVLWGVAALAYGGLALKAGLAQWPAAAALCAIAACDSACGSACGWTRSLRARPASMRQRQESR
ncbi:hypothetical protein [Verminephrobacter eiseniae]|uniref:hypothetical protein n=1 Tax=Verminephrobacter eiseniae TaxID=364317 RepID=UPI0002F77375|nr:hypothetical protein [Verminephrobacter eiseniae]MCW5284882.1 hypothetical protein [Verminephrobacter eiseniae]MCW5302590.1 hypothetical protein [Verminephrobacter eiseniae]MCW8190826.1 hypothetical protein [Verminephrobacter eiseniae]